MNGVWYLTPSDPSIRLKQETEIQINALMDHILAAQRPDGAIAWWPGHKIDPWDHVEAAMGLSVGGAYQQARQAFTWLQGQQLPDGSWFAAYGNGTASDQTRETHHAAYIAVGLYHYYLVTRDLDFIHRMWPAVERAVAFALRWQTDEGDIFWALDPHGRVDQMALLTGCSSIHFALGCAGRLAELIQQPRPCWQEARKRLRACIIDKPHRFNMTKARFAMDWFYPVLGGVLRHEAARKRIVGQWKKFVIENMGVRCVSDQPWVTIAETCELILALNAMGDEHNTLGRILFNWINTRTFEDDTFWCGFTVPDMAIWPGEKITWTNAVVLLAADALFGITPGADLFRHIHWMVND